MKKLTLFLVLISILAACRNDKSKTETIETRVDSLTYNYDSVTIYSTNIVKTDAKETDTTKAVIQYPVFKNEELNNYIQRQVLNYFSEEDKAIIAYQDIAKSFITGYDSFYNENKGTQQAWFLNIDVNVLHQTPNYIALEYIHSDYSGGAHPNTNFSFINYNPKTNQPLTLDSLIDKSNKARLTSISESIFRKDEKLSSTEPLEGKYFFSDGKFTLPDNFYVSNKGLVFFYNPYEIKAYAYGTTEITIPFAALREIAKPNTILTTTN
ncbi:DUF3298 domain-containing protein [Pedobacter frigiditerrae]|uniref:DUF3298 domain-containing protein n=1 Tax=Pedobacter frigiditerrae TaxID=2530452 RepID=A0A4R0MX35_9SPHI|nr:DUF3298 and DUF4163 domain-containing protein [Pedobacter frigiditerrae]TCC91818.1 DUF3298 domain-containing protein [Pedobacter frigiditerrae]